MDRTEAAKLIQDIADSLKHHPDQFHLQVSGVGAIGIARGGGTGISSTAIGGGPGSTAIGLQATVRGGEGGIQVVRGRADERTRQLVLELAQELISIARELRLSSPDVGRIRRIFDSLMNTWVPGVITSMLANVLTMALIGFAANR